MREAQALLSMDSLRDQLTALAQTPADKAAEAARDALQAKVTDLEARIDRSPASGSDALHAELRTARAELAADNAAYIDRRARSRALRDLVQSLKDSKSLPNFEPMDADALARQQLLTQNALEREIGHLAATSQMESEIKQLEAKQAAGQVKRGGEDDCELFGVDTVCVDDNCRDPPAQTNGT